MSQLNTAEDKRFKFVSSPIGSWPKWAQKDFRTISNTLVDVRMEALKERSEHGGLVPKQNQQPHGHSRTE